MTIQDLINAIEANFQEIKPGSVKADTNMHDLSIWNSFNMLLILTVVKEEFGVTVLWQELKNMKTVDDLYNAIIQLKKNES